MAGGSPDPVDAHRSTPTSGGDQDGPLSADEARLIDAYWRAANYLSVGQIYLLDNPLLRRPLEAGDVKPRLLGHWGTTPGLNMIYAHMNREIKARDLNAIYIIGPGHGGPGLVANTYLEGSYTDVYPSITRDEEGIRKLFRQFSFPGGITSPTILARIPEGELRDLMIGYGYNPYFVTGDDPAVVHQLLAAALDTVLDEIREIQSAARSGKTTKRPQWPMIVLRTPKGWTGPKIVDGKQVECTWRSHQVPITDVRT